MWSSWTPNENREWVKSWVGAPGRSMPKQWGIWRGWDRTGPRGCGLKSSMCHFSYSQQTELCGRRNKPTGINRLTTHGPNEYRGTQIQKAHGCPVQDAVRAIFFPGQCFVSHACMPRYIYFTPELFSRHCSALLSPLTIIIVLVLFLVCVCIAPNTIRSGVLRTELLQLWKRLNLEGATLMGFFQMWVPRLSSDV